jgi:hypothetical protein
MNCHLIEEQRSASAFFVEILADRAEGLTASRISAKCWSLGVLRDSPDVTHRASFELLSGIKKWFTNAFVEELILERSSARLQREPMRRMLQFATVMMLLACVIAPLSEFFDQWDTEGLSNDTEFGTVAFIFVLCLVLLLSKLISSLALRFDLCNVDLVRTQNCRRRSEFEHSFIFMVPPLFSLPVRI